MIDTSETLLDRLRACEAHDAWRQFYDLYWGAILRYGRKLGLTPEQAEDALQETMLVLMRTLPEFNYDPRKGKFRNFLLTIVHRKAITVLRRAQRRGDTPLAELPAEAEPRAAIPVEADEAAETRWRQAVVEEAIRGLRSTGWTNTRTWAIFDDYVVNGRPAGEVAAAHDVSENTVYQIKNRILRRLNTTVRRALRESGADAN